MFFCFAFVCTCASNEHYDCLAFGVGHRTSSSLKLDIHIHIPQVWVFDFCFCFVHRRHHFFF
jgi:hypothetical protein